MSLRPLLLPALVVALLGAGCAPAVAPAPQINRAPAPVARSTPPARPQPKPIPEAPESTSREAASLFELTVSAPEREFLVDRTSQGWMVTGQEVVFTVGFERSEFDTYLGSEVLAYEEALKDEPMWQVLYQLFLVMTSRNSGPKQINLSVLNATADSVSILWDESAMTLPNGSSSRVIHRGVRFNDMGSPQPPTIVPPGARVDELVAPTERIPFIAGDGYVQLPMTLEFGRGDTLRLFLVLEVAGERLPLNFIFSALESHSVLSERIAD